MIEVTLCQSWTQPLEDKQLPLWPLGALICHVRIATTPRASCSEKAQENRSSRPVSEEAILKMYPPAPAASADATLSRDGHPTKVFLTSWPTKLWTPVSRYLINVCWIVQCINAFLLLHNHFPLASSVSHCSSTSQLPLVLLMIPFLSLSWASILQRLCDLIPEATYLFFFFAILYLLEASHYIWPTPKGV